MIELPNAELLSRPPDSLPDVVSEGTHCWAKRPTDGLWYRGIVEGQVDEGSYVVQVLGRSQRKNVCTLPSLPVLLYALTLSVRAAPSPLIYFSPILPPPQVARRYR